MKILVTGAAGFIGYHVSKALLERGDEVVGIDNLNDYYDPNLKKARLAQLGVEDGKTTSHSHPHFHFFRLDIADRHHMERLFEQEKPERVIHLAAQAGVRYSIQNPHAYVDSNLVGFVNILEGCRHNEVEHLLYASSSSVYGANKKMPFSVEDNVDHPISLYAATKKANELMAHTYSHLYNLPTTGLRFFTVYGPWGRPDMAYFKFAEAIMNDKPIDVYNHGKMKRDFTYIDDIVEGVIRTCDQVATPQGAGPSVADKGLRTEDQGRSSAPYRIYNIGNNQPVELMEFIQCLETALGKKAKKNFLPMQPGDVPATYADVEALVQDVGFQPSTTIADGLGEFAEWFQGQKSALSVPKAKT